MTKHDTDYASKAREDAQEMANYFLDRIMEQLTGGEEVSDDFNNDYPGGDEYHHESHVDREYSLTEAAAILDQLSDHEETDDGSWQGLEPRKAVSAQAAYTYGNAVAYYWSQIIADINSDTQLADALADLEGGETDKRTVRELVKGIIAGE